MTRNTGAGDTDPRLEHRTAQSRFTLHLGDTLAAYADYTQRDGVRDFDHTVTDPQFRGRGLAGVVVQYALEETRKEGLPIATSCWYVDKFVAEHPEYRSLLS